jgi:hypothetical protein
MIDPRMTWERGLSTSIRGPVVPLSRGLRQVRRPREQNRLSPQLERAARGRKPHRQAVALIPVKRKMTFSHHPSGRVGAKHHPCYCRVRGWLFGEKDVKWD